MTKINEKVKLEMTWFEAGMLRGALMNKDDKGIEIFKRLPEATQLRMDIIFAQAYLRHETLAEQAKKDIKRYRKQLRELIKSGKTL